MSLNLIDLNLQLIWKLFLVDIHVISYMFLQYVETNRENYAHYYRSLLFCETSFLRGYDQMYFFFYKTKLSLIIIYCLSLLYGQVYSLELNFREG